MLILSMLWSVLTEQIKQKDAEKSASFVVILPVLLSYSIYLILYLENIFIQFERTFS